MNRIEIGIGPFKLSKHPPLCEPRTEGSRLTTGMLDAREKVERCSPRV